MSSMGQSGIVAGAIIAGALIISAAIVHAPQDKEITDQSLVQSSNESGTKPKKDRPVDQNKAGKTVDLTIQLSRLNISNNSRMWIFIDGENKGEWRQAGSDDWITHNFRVTPGEHSLVWVFYDKDDFNRVRSYGCAKLKLTFDLSSVYSLRNTSKLLDERFIGFDSKGQIQKKLDGTTLYARAVPMGPVILPRDESEAEVGKRLLKGLNKFKDTELWTLFNISDLKKAEKGPCRVKFPEYLGGLRAIGVEEMQMLEEIILLTFDSMHGLNPNQINPHENHAWDARAELKNTLDGYIQELMTRTTQ